MLGQRGPAVFPRPWVCRRIEPQVGERVREFSREWTLVVMRLGGERGSELSTLKLQILNQPRKLNLELRFSSVSSRIEN